MINKKGSQDCDPQTAPARMGLLGTAALAYGRMEFHMANEHVKEFTDGNFETEVIASDKPVLVDFWAQWCQPCMMLSPIVDAVAAELAGKAKVGKVDIEANKGLPAQFQVMAIPTIIIFKGGKPVKRFVGMKKKDDLMAALAEAGAV